MSKFESFYEMKVIIDKEEDLYQYNILSSFFEYRTLFFLVKSIGKLSSNVENKMNLFDAWNNSQVFGLNNLAKAYGELYVLNCFYEKIDSISDSHTKQILNSLMVLFSLTSIERDLSVFLQNNFISGDACDMIRNEILNICSRLTQQLIPLIDAISPPDEILGAPFGSSEGHVNNYLIRYWKDI